MRLIVRALRNIHWRDARGQLEQLGEIAAVQGEIVDLLGGNDSAKAGARCLKLRVRRFYSHVRRLRAYRERHIDCRLLSDSKGEHGDSGGPKSSV